MIDWSASNVNFVIAAYIGSAVLIAIAIVNVAWRSRQLKKSLRELNLPDVGDGTAE